MQRLRFIEPLALPKALVVSAVARGSGQGNVDPQFPLQQDAGSDAECSGSERVRDYSGDNDGAKGRGEHGGD